MAEIAADDHAVKRATISEHQQIPLPFLSQVLSTLVNSGLIKSIRGPDGGYVLIRPATDISLLEIVTKLQGPIVPRGCLDTHNPEICLVGGDECLLREVWSALRSANERVLGSVTLADISSVHRGGQSAPRLSR